MKPRLQPMDIVVVDGQWWMPHHWLIRWRSFDKGVHVFTVSNESGHGWSPDLSGLLVTHINEFAGRRVTIHRFKGNATPAYQQALKHWKLATGYDFRQWLLGGILGITKKSWVENSTQYTCAEFPYWSFQDAEHITPTEDIVPLPRLFRYHPQFEILFDGVW